MSKKSEVIICGIPEPYAPPPYWKNPRVSKCDQCKNNMWLSDIERGSIEKHSGDNVRCLCYICMTELELSDTAEVIDSYKDIQFLANEIINPETKSSMKKIKAVIEADRKRSSR